MSGDMRGRQINKNRMNESTAAQSPLQKCFSKSVSPESGPRGDTYQITF